MQRYKIRVQATTYCTIEVEAENDASAISKAEERASYGYHEWSDTKTVNKGHSTVLMSGPVGEPLITMPTTWQIYSFEENEKPAKIANAKITAAVRMAAADILARHKNYQDIDTDYLLTRYRKYIAPVLAKYSKLGTYDTEPRAQIANTLSKYAAYAGMDIDQAYDCLRYA